VVYFLWFQVWNWRNACNQFSSQRY